MSDGMLTLLHDDTALKYSEKPEVLKAIMEEMKVSFKIIKVGPFFDDDKEDRVQLMVTVARGNNTIKFPFGMSIRDTEILTWKPHQEIHTGYSKVPMTALEINRERLRIKQGLLYSLLTTMRSEYYCPTPFEEFCSEYGYDSDSRKAEKLYQRCLEMSAELHKILNDEDVECLPQ
jgi:hypothetical protein